MGKISGRPFVFLTTFFIIGIVISHLTSFSPLIYVTGFLLCSIFLGLKSRMPLLLLIVLLVLFGGLRYSLTKSYPTNHISNLVGKLGNEKLHVTGIIADEPLQAQQRTRFTLALQNIEGIPISGKIALTIQGLWNGELGDSIQFRGRVQAPYPNSNPYSFNYKEYLEREGIYGTTFLYSTDIKSVSSRVSLGQSLVLVPRRWMRQRIDGLYGETEAGFIKAILLGEKDALSKKLKDDFSNAGLSHILAVSGLHTGVIALILLTIIPVVVRNRNVARIITIVILIYYVFLSHSAPSVQRAVIMISLVLIAKILQKPADNINILFAAAFIILLIDPRQLFTLGFQFSFLSVFAILVIYPVFRKVLYPLQSRFEPIYWLLNLMLLSFVIQLLLAPLTAYYFHQVPFGGIIANVAAIPLVSLILPLTLLTIFFPIASLNVYYVAANNLLMNILFRISDLVSTNRILLLDFINLEIWQVISIFGIVGVLIFVWQERYSFKRKFSYVIGGGSALILIIILPLIFYPPKLTLTVLDVSQGDAIFLQTPSRKNILIDTGDKRDTKDYGEQVVVPFLRANQIRTLDLLVLTHPHSDHIGGAAYVLDNVKVKTILIPLCNYESELFDNLWKKITEKEIPVVFADTLLVFEQFPRMKMRVLSPYQGYVTTNVNNYSVVLQCVYKDFSFILTGDAEAEVEEWLCGTYGEELDVDMLKIGHHGSKSSSTDIFLDMVTPEYAAISVGRYNRFGHPSTEVLTRLDGYGIDYFRTDEDGAIIFTYNGERLEIRTILSEKEIFVEDI
jgi:competence protein ComEC